MRPQLCIAALAVLTIAGCDGSQTQQNVTSIKVRSAEQDQLFKLNDLNRAIALKRAIYDSGYQCQRITKSGFVGFERDAYTTLAEAEDRIMATRVTATWGYGAAAARRGFDFDAAHARALERLLTTFAEHVSPSVQTSIWIMASAMLDADPAIDWVRMVLPNLHHWTVDLGPFGLENRGEVFVATSEPHGLIDATVRRRS